jgi:ACS family glucarate transporter-like MFS transporter
MNEPAGLAVCSMIPKSIGVVIALVLLSMITYADRTAISTAKDAVAEELMLSDRAMGFVFSVFALGYAFAQIPAGILVDKYGPHLILGGAVGIWSLLTLLAGAAWSFASLLTFLFLFGVGEAAVFPGSARAICNWLAPGQRGRANGALFAGSRVGAALSYPLLAWMITIWSWRNAFVILAIVGLLWAAVWMLCFGDFPAKDRSFSVEQARLERETAPPIDLTLLRLVPAMVQYFASNFTNFIGLSWMLPFLKGQYHLSSADAALDSMIPLLFGATSQGVSGWVVDRMFSSALRKWSRRIPAMIGFMLSAAGLIVVMHAHSAVVAVFGFALAVFGADMTICPSWVFCVDIAGKHTGRITGAMNTFGSIGAFVSANAFPFLNKRLGNSSAYFLLAAVLDIVALICWIRMTSVQSEEHRSGIKLEEMTL